MGSWHPIAKVWSVNRTHPTAQRVGEQIARQQGKRGKRLSLLSLY